MLWASADLGFVRFAAEPWSKLEEISIDYQLMENKKSGGGSLFSKWSDLETGKQFGQKA